MTKNIGKNVSRKYGQKLIGYAKESATVTLKITSKKATKKLAEVNGNLISNKIA